MAHDIPVISLAPFVNDGAQGRRSVAAAIARAYETLGFLVVSDHGLTLEDGAALHRTALNFFDLPLEKKLAVRRPKNDQNRGYIPYGEEPLP